MKASTYDNLIGEKIGRLFVIKRVDDKIDNDGNRRPQFLCKCDCGNEKIICGKNLRKGTKSCGCLHSESLILENKSRKKCNIYDLTNDYGIVWNEDKTVSFKFDLDDYDKIKDIYWNDHKGYAYGGNINSNHLQMSRLIMGVTDSNLEVDHINHDTRDNRKCNLRIVTHQQNLFNNKLRKDNTSGVTGVCYLSGINKYMASITYNNKTINLGCYDCFEDAVSKRKYAENKYFGEYSYDNSQKIFK